MLVANSGLGKLDRERLSAVVRGTKVPGVNYLGRSASIILAGGSEACWV